ncbi:MAG: hypothetical protein ACFE0R_07185 [Salinarimonas sp.]
MTFPFQGFLLMPTHSERQTCELRVRELADYMAASQQRRRSMLRQIKYPPLARLLNHKEARSTISYWLREGGGDTSALSDKAERFRTRMATTDFEAMQNQYNSDYVDTFAGIYDKLDIPACEMEAPYGKQTISLGGTSVIYNPDLNLRRVTIKNTVKVGGLFLRYAKDKKLDASAAQFQSAFTFGFLKATMPQEDAKPEHKLCLTVCAYSGALTEAPSNSVYLFNEMEAACASIAERWANIEPPPNAEF